LTAIVAAAAACAVVNRSRGTVPLMTRRFNGVKVFTATMFADRGRLGETVTTWLAARPELQIDDIVVTQSSDASFHCIAITVFYWDPR
jgi:hypothetical protein